MTGSDGSGVGVDACTLTSGWCVDRLDVIQLLCLLTLVAVLMVAVGRDRHR